jgi:hypothetical protein
MLMMRSEAVSMPLKTPKQENEGSRKDLKELERKERKKNPEAKRIPIAGKVRAIGKPHSWTRSREKVLTRLRRLGYGGESGRTKDANKPSRAQSQGASSQQKRHAADRIMAIGKSKNIRSG